MNQYKGKYYLQYAVPGTEFKSYSNGVYVSENPLGPFTLLKHNPFSYKPEGFVNGTGHGSTFQDLYGNYWNIGTSTISRRHMFEEGFPYIQPSLTKMGMFMHTQHGETIL